MRIDRLRKALPRSAFAMGACITFLFVGVSLHARQDIHAMGRKGIHPDALAALAGASLAERITRGIDRSPGRWNVHGQDGTFTGRKPYTAAVDLSIRALSDVQIKEELACLAAIGFIAWYRKPGHDGWPRRKRPHIHAVWVACRLKRNLMRQVASWLDGRNGLASDAPYAFWQPTQDVKEAIRQRLGARSRDTGQEPPPHE